MIYYMTRATKETLWTLAYITTGLLSGVLTWLIISARSPHRLAILPFIVLGLAGGLIYAAVRLRGLGYSILMVILLFFLQLALNPPVRALSAIRAAFWAVPIGTAFLLSSYIFKYLTRIPLGKFLLMAVIIGTAHWLVVFLFQLRLVDSLPRTIFFSQLMVGALFGAMMGLIIEVLELLFPPQKDALNPPLNL